MNPTRLQVLAAVLAAAVIVLLGVGAVTGVLVSPLPADGPVAESDDEPATTGERPDEPSTTETVGYVEGYWYDDELAVDDRDDAALDDEELEAVVYRSMARVEQLRNLTFDEEVPVDVVSREQFEAEDDGVVGNASATERLSRSVTYETLFMVDRETPLEAELEELYGGTVEGYYDPSTDEVVVVSDNPESPELDEVVLGHELLHALQDQHFDLASYQRETIDQDAAKNGLIEGDAVWIDTEYEKRCLEAWDCVQPEGETVAPPTINYGLYLIVFQPYSDGPGYVEYHLEDGDWEAVDDLYDDPPVSSAEVIRPGDDREPADLSVADRSSDEWERFGSDDGGETVGEVGMVSMFAAGTMDHSRPAVIDSEAFFTDDVGYDYDQPPTDGWAGDELVVYAHADLDPDGDLAAGDVSDARDQTAYVWASTWETDADARQFLEAYEQLLEGYDADPVDDWQATYVIDDEFPGAYAIDRDGETVTIVRAPSVDDLAAVDGGVFADSDTDSALEGPATTANEDAGREAAADSIDGFGFGSASVAIVTGVGTAIVVVRTRNRRQGRGP
ncbi:Hvo_1808 family surface protein [Salinadaptatus halalkaliphilus]|uniref:Hvo_1808 family surface protein n=1 Tax=Salinadaptatus halalkaliphilus TaxID=2419781 RepID=UPI0015809E74|nr:Hvo_1808 family surface protein [Salinadaptatus halalkaliphilus]